MTPPGPKPPAGGLRGLEERLGYHFARPRLLEQALTHSSRAHEDGDLALGNERLEFLGDAVLDLLVSEILVESHPQADEGTLSRARAGAVNTQALALHARALGLSELVRLGRGEQRSGGGAKPSILANVLEAVLGAIYLDGGLAAVRGLVVREFGAALRRSAPILDDPKTQLQEALQQGGRELPRYATTAERGPAHAREFEVQVVVGRDVLGAGVGRSKREAEQEAARRALEALTGDGC